MQILCHQLHYASRLDVIEANLKNRRSQNAIVRGKAISGGFEIVLIALITFLVSSLLEFDTLKTDHCSTDPHGYICSARGDRCHERRFVTCFKHVDSNFEPGTLLDHHFDTRKDWTGGTRDIIWNQYLPLTSAYHIYWPRGIQASCLAEEEAKAKRPLVRPEKRSTREHM